MTGLLALSTAALASLGAEQTFKLDNVESKATKTGNVGFRVTTDQGKTVTFFSSNMDKVVEAVDEAAGTYRIIPGTRYAEDGGLIPADAKQGGLWS